MPLTIDRSDFTHSRRLAALLIVAALGLMALLSARPAAAAVQEHLTIPLEGLVFADEGCGEGYVHTAGTLHVLITRTENANRVTETFHFQPQGAKLVGLTSGDEYVGTGVTRQTVTSSTDSPQSTLTFVNNFRIIGKGQAPSLLVHEVLHVTVNTDGEITASIEHASLECR